MLSRSNTMKKKKRWAKTVSIYPFPPALWELAKGFWQPQETDDSQKKP